MALMDASKTTSLGEFVRLARAARSETLTDFAKRAGLTKSEVSAIENGKIGLPGGEKRRRIAEALGVRHVDILVAAGELAADEIPQEGEPRELFPSGDIRSMLVTMLEDLDPSHPISGDRLQTLMLLLNGWIQEQRKGPSQ